MKDAAAVDYLRVVAKEFRESGSIKVAAGVDKAAEELLAAAKHLDAIADALGYPRESWRIAGCDTLAHAVKALQDNYIALRDGESRYVGEKPKPLCYVLVNAAGEMYWSEDGCVWSHPGDAEDELIYQGKAEPEAGWRVEPLFISGERST